MPLETGSVINDLTETNPTLSDPAGQGDDHLRLIKTCLKGSLPQMGGIFGQVRSQDTNATINSLHNTSVIVVTNSATATVVLTLPTAASITTGWSVDVITRTGANAVITPAAGSINGAATFAVPPFTYAKVVYGGANVWFAARSGSGEGLETVDNLYVRGTLSVSGAAHMSTTLSVSGNVTFGATLTVSGGCTMNGILSVSGNAIFKTGVSVGGAVSMGLTLTVSGAAVLGSTLNVTGVTTLGNNLAVTGNTALNGTVSISGLATLQSGQLLFPTVQNASANANCLDDYEEGSFTPTLTFATAGDLAVTYSARIGQYTKIGDMMMVTIRIATSAFTHTTAAGAFRITGLPAALLSTAGNIVGVHVAEFSGVAVAAGRTQVSAQVAASATLMDFTTLNLSSGGAFNVATSEAITASNKTIILTLTYKTST